MVFVDDPDFQLHVGDALQVLAGLPAESVHCVVTSPPYWGLRDYGTGSWDGGDDGCDHAPVSGLQGASEYSQRADRTFTGSKPQGQSCSRCGARRVDHQLGLEPTPDEYVTNMVAVFRQVRRVLRRDGTCWLNIGDSYASGEVGRVDAPHKNVGLAKTQKPRAERRVQQRSGLKPKDLVGIPWRLAFALQQPWERRVVEAATDRAWLAGLVDGEGCVSVVAVQPTTGTNESHSMRLQIRMADVEAVERVVAVTHMSNVTYDQDTGQGNRPAQQWKISGDRAADVLADIFPFLTVKRRQAIVGWNIQRLKDGIVTKRGQPIPAENMAKRRLLHDVLRDLNQRRPVDIPSWCRLPEVETEPGWYLRADVIWSKPNPMPESVTDRPTKAHEYGGHGTVHRAGREKGAENFAEARSRNKRSVWEIATEPYPEAHFATFPQALVEPCVLAGTSEHGCCPECGAPWERETERTAMVVRPAPKRAAWQASGDEHARTAVGGTVEQAATSTTTGWRPTCRCTETLTEEGGVNESSSDHGGQQMSPLRSSEIARFASTSPPAASASNDQELKSMVLAPVPCTVLDPFMGSGTTALVARRLGRRTIGIELSREYAELAATRLQQLSLLAEGAA